MKNNPLVIAHRGYSAKFPENTLAAFSAAIDLGVDMIELDLQLTRDHQVIVIHDYWLGRTVEGSGYVHKLTLEQIRSGSAGSWFSKKFSKEKAPTLSEVLDLCKNKVDLNLEIKGKAHRLPGSQARFAGEVLKKIRQARMEKQIVISSFESAMLKAVRKFDPKIRLGVLDDHPEKLLQLKAAEKIGAYSYHPNFKRLTLEQAVELRKHGLKIYPYTANSEAEFTLLRGLEVDGVITNEIEGLQGFLTAAK